MESLMKFCVVGLGYMGLPTALLIAKQGFSVTGYDINKTKIDQLNKGVLPFEERGLEELFQNAKLTFSASDSIEKVDANVFIISVPTPFTDGKKCDLEYVINATKTVASQLKHGGLVILESTVSPGTTMNVVRPILELTGMESGKDFYLSYVSEKAIPGNTILEMVKNDRIIGAIDEKSAEKTKQVYKIFVQGALHITDCTTAETVKLVENTYRDINIAFANELADICSKLGVNVWEVIDFANKHPRVHLHNPGPGVGGHCIAVDPWFLAERFGGDLIKLSRSINDRRPDRVGEKILDICKQMEISKPRITILGVAYKPDVDDFRESPAIEIIKFLENHGCDVIVHDPIVKQFPYKIELDLDIAINGADIIVIITDHKFYRSISKQLKGKKVIDTRNIGLNESILIGRDF
jgi:UDP-N-acetyl-D-mannosaminuronic acid dehydrogenase